MRMIEAIERSTKFFRSPPQDAGVRPVTPASNPTAQRNGIELRNVDLFRLVAFLLLLPNAIFAFSFRAAPGFAILLACAIGAATLWRNPIAKDGVLAARVDLRGLLVCVGAAMALCLAGGGGHFFYAPADWLWRDAVLADLVRTGPTTTYLNDGQIYLLRAPLGMYLLPSLVGKAFGLHGAHLAQLAQNATLLGIALYSLAQFAEARRTPFVLLIICFSGADIAPVLYLVALEFARTFTFAPFSQIELEWWTQNWITTYLQYSSHITQWFWVPNHMIPGWWLTILCLLRARREIDFASLGVMLGAAALWSPLAALGAVPFVALLAILQGPREWLTARVAVGAAAALALTPILIYLGLDADAVPHGWLVAVPGVAFILPLFFLVEIPHAGIVAYGWRRVQPVDRPLIALAIVVLLLIPLYRIGEFNDFAMRASIPALLLLAVGFARVAVLTPRDNGGFATAIGVVTLLGLANPLVAAKDSFAHAYAISDCSLITAWSKTTPKKPPTNYWARIETAPTWLISGDAQPVVKENRLCWPDHTLLLERMR